MDYLFLLALLAFQGFKAWFAISHSRVNRHRSIDLNPVDSVDTYLKAFSRLFWRSVFWIFAIWLKFDSGQEPSYFFDLITDYLSAEESTVRQPTDEETFYPNDQSSLHILPSENLQSKGADTPPADFQPPSESGQEMVEPKPYRELPYQMPTFIVQFGAFTTWEAARTEISEIQSEVYSPLHVLDEDGYFKVCAVGFSLREEAKQFCKDSKRKCFVLQMNPAW